MENQRPVRKNDFFLMDIIMKAPVPFKYKQIFNQVRIYMKVTLASDIVVIGTKSKIHPNAMKGEQFRESALEWPKSLPYPKKMENNMEIVAPRLHYANIIVKTAWSLHQTTLPNLQHEM